MLSLTSLALSVAGSHYYLSEFICLTLICYSFSKSINRSYLIIGIFAVTISIITQLNNIELLHLYIYFLFFCSISLKKTSVSYRDNRYFQYILLFNCVLSVIVGLETYIGSGTPPISSNYLCLYGDRSTACHVHSYMIGGMPFIRLYGISSEPQVFALYILYSLILVNIHGLKISKRVSIFAIICFIFTFSLTMYALAVVIFLTTNIFIRDLTKRFYALIASSAFIAVIYLLLENLKDSNFIAFILYKRTFSRLFELFSGEDRSAVLRTQGTFKPLRNYLDAFHEYPFGVSLQNALDYIQNATIMARFDDVTTVIQGQPSSSLIYYIIAFGIYSPLAFMIFSMKLNNINKIIVLLLLTYVNPYGLSAAVFLMFAGLNLKRFTHAQN